MGVSTALGSEVTQIANKSTSLLLQGNKPAKVEDQFSPDENDRKNRMYISFTEKKLDHLVSEANKILNHRSTALHYVLHNKLNQYYVQIVDEETKQVIREIPPKKFLDMYAAIAEKMGLIVNKRI
ncbi:flagellar protein FlaG [Sporolactobacillus sp. THM7-4]|nr:flagellar protein FlaG [Sporolactobacillus sp. THM7-4]